MLTAQSLLKCHTTRKKRPTWLWPQFTAPRVSLDYTSKTPSTQCTMRKANKKLTKMNCQLKQQLPSTRCNSCLAESKKRCMLRSSTLLSKRRSIIWSTKIWTWQRTSLSLSKSLRSTKLSSIEKRKRTDCYKSRLIGKLWKIWPKILQKVMLLCRTKLKRRIEESAWLVIQS